MLNQIDNTLISLTAIDQIPKGVPKHVYDRILELNQGRTGDLAFQLDIKISARVMLTSNVDISDRLINGQIGTIVYVYTRQNVASKIVYVIFDDQKAGSEKIKSDRIAQQYRAVPIERVTTDIRTSEKKNFFSYY